MLDPWLVAAVSMLLDVPRHAAGASYATVVKTTVFLVSMSDYAAVNEVYGKCAYFAGGIAHCAYGSFSPCGLSALSLVFRKNAGHEPFPFSAQ